MSELLTQVRTYAPDNLLILPLAYACQYTLVCMALSWLQRLH